MKRKIIYMVFLFSNIAFASDGAIPLYKFFADKNDKIDSAKILLLGNISTEQNSIANLDLGYFESNDCSLGYLGNAAIFDKVSPIVIKQKKLLKMLGATVYRAGEQQIGSAGMAKVHSISVRLGGHNFSKSDVNKQAYFFVPDYSKFSKFYCVKNVICANQICQSNEHFTPFTAFGLYNSYPLEHVTEVELTYNMIVKFMYKYYSVAEEKQNFLTSWYKVGSKS